MALDISYREDSIRKIPYKDHFLTGIINKFFNYEILLPENYYMIYKDSEELGPLSINGNIEKIYLSSNNDNITNNPKVTIVNMNPKELKFHKFDNSKSEYENNLEYFMDLVDSCFNMCIYMDSNNIIYDIYINYIYYWKDGEDLGFESFEMMDDMNPQSPRARYYCRVKY